MDAARLLHGLLDFPLVCATVEFNRRLQTPAHAASLQQFSSLLSTDASVLEVFQYLLRNVDRDAPRPTATLMRKHRLWTGELDAYSDRTAIACDLVPLLLQPFFEAVIAGDSSAPQTSSSASASASATTARRARLNASVLEVIMVGLAARCGLICDGTNRRGSSRPTCLVRCAACVGEA